MFYSHQLLARKAPLGQIWMAATMHEKMNRKKLDKLNIIKICEEILYPTVPMALRLSGILMGGVVIVYERKVKLLYDDVNRLLVELNEAWKVKAAPSDPTRLPKHKTQAKYEAVTLPKIRAEDLEEMEQSVPYPVVDFQQTSYIAMRLDSVDDPNLFQNTNDDRHQVDAANITLEDNYDPHQADTNVFDRFERFDIEGYEDFSPADLENPTTLISTPPLIPTPPPLISSPPPPAEPNRADEIQEQYPEDKVHQQSNESKDANKVQIKRRTDRPTWRAALIMDNRQTVIPGDIYQTWLKNPSDLKRERKQKKPEDPLSTFKIHTLLDDLPSVVLSERLFTSGLKIHYPPELLRDWLRITQSPHDSPSGRASAPKPPEPSASSLPEAMHFMGPMKDTFEDYDMGAGPQSPRISIERQRTMVDDNNEPPERLMEMLRYNLRSKGLGAKETDGVGRSKSNLMASPANSGDDIRSIPSSGSGNGFPSQNSNVNSGSRKRPFSAINISPNGLEPVAEELSWEHPEFKLKISRVSGRDTPNDELMVETGPTQTQMPQSDKQQPPDPVTEAVREQLKTHFETPGNANIQSLLELASGMNRKGAARLFYQTCVLATRECIRVQQKVPYGDILISRGPKM